MNSTLPTRFLQANLNHSAGAQDLFLQSMAEWSIDIAVAAEPYLVSSNNINWAGDTEGLVALVRRASASSSIFSLKERGSGYVAVKWGTVTIIGVYFSPNRTFAEFESFMDQLGHVVHRALPGPVFVLGDLNAKSMTWGSPATDARGEVVEDWAIATGLALLNRGSTNTCVRQQGGSIVDVSFATPAVAQQVIGWRVIENEETLSDHRYIRFEVSSSYHSGVNLPEGSASPFPRWAIKKLDKDLLIEAAIVQTWFSQPVTSPVTSPADVENETNWFAGALTQMCDVAMPRVKRMAPKRAVYWWTEELANLRAASIATQRSYTRYRRRRVKNTHVEDQLHQAYKTAKKTLQLAICRSKSMAREELLSGLDRDPWGRPYNTARGKLRTLAPPITESLEPQLLESVVDELFPIRTEHEPPRMAIPQNEPISDALVPPVTTGELGAAFLRLRSKNTAPGPDGIPGRVWVLVSDLLEERFRLLLDSCLATGCFPMRWKSGRLVLLRKAGRQEDSPSAYRPIVLLDEAGKLFERVLAHRIIRHLAAMGPDLADCQYGFRHGRSTIDAVKYVKELSDEAVRCDDVLLAISLDIANAFNTLPFSVIEEALRYHGVPPYLRRVLGNYLRGRRVLYLNRYGRLVRKSVSCGVPQGSVLGPLLWNIGYDWVLRGTLLRGLRVVCYADDTLVTARGDSFNEAIRLGTVGVTQVVRRIELLGLKVALNKTEAIFFYGPRKRPPSGACLRVEEVSIEIGTHMKYLGLVLDGKWLFNEHFRRLAPKLIEAAAALGRLLPNLGGPSASVRRLYTGVVRSMALYGAPVWVHALSAKNMALLRRPQRVMAIRVCRGYRTVSFEAACALAGTPPWELEAEVLARVYEYSSRVRVQGDRAMPEDVQQLRQHAKRATLRQWRERLEQSNAGNWTTDAIQPVLERWVHRKEGKLTFRLVQVLSGHGCFGSYLHKIGRETSSACHHCGATDDTAMHTLMACPEWTEPRAALTAQVGRDLSLPTVVQAMVGDKNSWEAMVTFCEHVMSQKEAAERAREDNVLSDAIRRRRTGRRRRAYALLRPP